MLARQVAGTTDIALADGLDDRRMLIASDAPFVQPKQSIQT